MAEEVSLSPAERDDCPSVASLLNHVVAGIRAIEGQYATTIMMAVKRLAEDLSAQFAADSGGKGADLQQLMASSRKAFEDRILNSYDQRNAERDSLYGAMKDVDTWTRVDLFKEIAQTELAIENSEAHIQWMLWDTSVDLARIMRARLYQSELKAYLRGLRFQATHENAELPSDSESSPDLTPAG